MLQQIIILILSGIILCFPLVFWMYVFTSFAHLGVTRKQFLFGLGAGALSTLPLLYENIFVIGNLIEEVFFSLSFIVDSFLGVSLLVSISLFFMLMFLLSFIGGKLFFKELEIQKYIVSFLGIITIFGIFSLSIYMISLFSGNNASEVKIESGSFVFIGFVGIMSYYVVISLLEEGMKYVSNLGLIAQRKTLSFESMLASGAVVALGFAFFENILYSYTYILQSGADLGLLRVVFFRSLFTVALHVLCGMLISGGFYMILILRGKYDKAYILFAVFSFLAITSHALFDVALTFGYVGVVFLYLFMLYLAVGYITSSE